MRKGYTKTNPTAKISWITTILGIFLSYNVTKLSKN